MHPVLDRRDVDHPAPRLTYSRVAHPTTWLNSGMAVCRERPTRLVRTQCGNLPAKERSELRKAPERGRYICPTLLLNHGALRLEPAEVDQVSRALGPMAATHLALTFANHLSEVEPS